MFKEFFNREFRITTDKNTYCCYRNMGKLFVKDIYNGTKIEISGYEPTNRKSLKRLLTLIELT